MQKLESQDDRVAAWGGVLNVQSTVDSSSASVEHLQRNSMSNSSWHSQYICNRIFT